jgi:hypothetical protein
MFLVVYIYDIFNLSVLFLSLSFTHINSDLSGQISLLLGYQRKFFCRAKLAKIKKEEVLWTEGSNVQLLDHLER